MVLARNQSGEVVLLLANRINGKVKTVDLDPNADPKRCFMMENYQTLCLSKGCKDLSLYGGFNSKTRNRIKYHEALGITRVLSNKVRGYIHASGPHILIFQDRIHIIEYNLDVNVRISHLVKYFISPDIFDLKYVGDKISTIKIKDYIAKEKIIIDVASGQQTREPCECEILKWVYERPYIMCACGSEVWYISNGCDKWELPCGLQPYLEGQE